MKKYIAIVLFLSFSFVSSGQIGRDLSLKKHKSEDQHLLVDNQEWFEGSVMLNNGAELKGLLRYITRNGILSYQDGTETKLFTPLRVAGFEFFDERTSKQRVFYTFKYEDSNTNLERPLFFELLRDYKTFAVLSKVDRVDLEQKYYSPAIAEPTAYQFGTTNVRLEISQTETIFLMDSEGNIKPYIKATISQDGVTDIFTNKDSKTKNKMIDRDLIEEYVSPEHYKKLLEYAKHYTLNFKVKSDLMKILDHYEKLISR